MHVSSPYSSRLRSTSRSDTSISSSEWVDARRFLLKLLLFALPCLIYPLFIYVVDPFNFLNPHSPVSNEAKQRTAAKLNPFFWKMNLFAKKPAANILLGDSTIRSLRPEKIQELTGEEYFNFAYGGGTLKEAANTFWFAAQSIKLRRVYIGINLIHYNDAAYDDRTGFFIRMQQRPANYFFDRTVLQSALYATYSELTRTDPEIGVPHINRETGWRETLESNARVYRDFTYPTKYRQELMKIVQYCKEHEIEVFFLILPSHVDLQRLRNEYKLEQTRDQIKRELSEMAPVYDFDFENELTSNQNNFKDPIHYTDQVGDLLVYEIWGGHLQHGRKLP
jgi:hypothetical protein